MSHGGNGDERADDADEAVTVDADEVELLDEVGSHAAGDGDPLESTRERARLELVGDGDEQADDPAFADTETELPPKTEPPPSAPPMRAEELQDELDVVSKAPVSRGDPALPVAPYVSVPAAAVSRAEPDVAGPGRAAPGDGDTRPAPLPAPAPKERPRSARVVSRRPAAASKRAASPVGPPPPPVQPRDTSSSIAKWAAAIAVVAGIAYWAGARTSSPAAQAALGDEVRTRHAAPRRDEAPPAREDVAPLAHAEVPAQPTAAPLDSPSEATEPAPSADAVTTSRADAAPRARTVAEAAPVVTRGDPAPPVQLAARPAADAPDDGPRREPPPLVDGELAPAVANAALARAASQAASCAGAGPRGSGSIKVTFDPSGGVGSASVRPPFQGTEVGACVERHFRAASTPSFRGTPVATYGSFNVTSPAQ